MISKVTDARVAVVGAGRVGLACAKILLNQVGCQTVVLVDTLPSTVSTERLERNLCGGATAVVLSNLSELEAVLAAHRIETVICATPFNYNTAVAMAAAGVGANYIDFTEDIDVSAAVSSINTSASSVSQTGLAPGLITYMGLRQFEGMGKPKSLDLRVGALPAVAKSPHFYAITWSPEGLVNEYIKPALRKVDGKIEAVHSLEFQEELVLGGIKYEAFTTSGGVGDLATYDEIPSVEYKTLRYPGHLKVARELVSKPSFNEMVDEAKRTFPSTRQDVVVFAAVATDESNFTRCAAGRIKGNSYLDLTALELSTAGTGCAIVELLSAGSLPQGVVRADMIPFDQLLQTRSYRLIAESTDSSL